MFQDFCYSDTVRPSRSDEVLKLTSFEKVASLKLSSYQIKNGGVIRGQMGLFGSCRKVAGGGVEVAGYWRETREKDEEFKQPHFESYRPKFSEDIPNELKEYLDAHLVKDRVLDNKDCSVKSLVVVEKKTIVHIITKVEFVRPKQQEKSVRKPVKYAEMYRKRVVSGNNSTKVTYNNSTRKTHPSAHKKMAPRAVLVKTGLIPPNTARPKAVNTARPKAVNTARPSSAVVNVVRGHPQKVQEDQGYVDSRCTRHMTGNMSYLLDFKEFNKGYVTFRGGANSGRITGKGTIKTNNLDFEDVYFVKELKFNLFSVSQMCDRKNNVLFTDTECLILSPNFKLPDESQILLRVPRKNNMYSVDMKNIVPKESLTCLVAKAALDESML
uniref:Ribonuclease H-like domain-containing protein n=1 Tax=Tanacetum cinerariifolium TaxID=118510 RepID=A0A6L2NR69_TANCI|nr:ribonuclease H-like domain-containing protein [Tanacetum cinerariifolium]